MKIRFSFSFSASNGGNPLHDNKTPIASIENRRFKSVHERSGGHYSYGIRSVDAENRGPSPLARSGDELFAPKVKNVDVDVASGERVPDFDGLPGGVESRCHIEKKERRVSFRTRPTVRR